MLSNVSAGMSNNLEQLKAQMEAAKQSKEQKTTEQTGAESTKNTAETQKTAADNTKTTAQQVSTAAQNAVTLAEQVKGNAAAELATATSELSGAQAALSAAQAAATEDNPNTAAIAAAQAAVTAAQKHVEQANIAYEAAAKALEQAQEAAKQAAEALETAEAEAENAAQALEEAVTALDEAIQATDEAIQEFQEAEEAYDKALEEAKNSVDVQQVTAAGVQDVEEPCPMTEEEAVAAGYTIVRTVEDLQQIRENLGAKFILMGDLDLSSIDSWAPIGDSRNPFTGVFNGNGHTITGLNIDSKSKTVAGNKAAGGSNFADYSEERDGKVVTNVGMADITVATDERDFGFFGVVENAVIKNVEVKDAKINGAQQIAHKDLSKTCNVGIIAGTARGTVFENISVSGDVSGQEYIGGVVGMVADADYVKFVDYKTGDVEVNVGTTSFKNVNADVNLSGFRSIGGLAGKISSSTEPVSIIDCETHGSIKTSSFAGALASEAGPISIHNFTSDMNITGVGGGDDALGKQWENGTLNAIINAASKDNTEFENVNYSGLVDGKEFPEFDVSHMDELRNQYLFGSLPGVISSTDLLSIDGVSGINEYVLADQRGLNTGSEVVLSIEIDSMEALDKVVEYMHDHNLMGWYPTEFKLNFDFEENLANGDHKYALQDYCDVCTFFTLPDGSKYGGVYQGNLAAVGAESVLNLQSKYPDAFEGYTVPAFNEEIRTIRYDADGNKIMPNASKEASIDDLKYNIEDAGSKNKTKCGGSGCASGSCTTEDTKKSSNDSSTNINCTKDNSDSVKQVSPLTQNSGKEEQNNYENDNTINNNQNVSNTNANNNINNNEQTSVTPSQETTPTTAQAPAQEQSAAQTTTPTQSQETTSTTTQTQAQESTQAPVQQQTTTPTTNQTSSQETTSTTTQTQTQESTPTPTTTTSTPTSEMEEEEDEFYKYEMEKLKERDNMFREHIANFAQTLRAKVLHDLKRSFGLEPEEETPVISKSEYEKLVKKAIEKGGVDKLSKDEQLAMAIYQIDRSTLSAVDKSSLEGVTTYQMTTEIDGEERDLFTNLKGDMLVQKLDENGNPIEDEYEYADGSGDYIGFDKIYAQLGVQATDEDGNLLFTDADGAKIKQITDKDGNKKFVTTDKDGNEVDYKGDTEKLSVLLTPYNLKNATEGLKEDMMDILADVKDGKFPKEVSEDDIIPDKEDDVNADEKSDETEAVPDTDETDKSEEILDTDENSDGSHEEIPDTNEGSGKTPEGLSEEGDVNSETLPSDKTDDDKKKEEI